jgi:hypothetical protein
VPAITSMGKIERCLVEAGATDISKKYNEKVCTAIRFRMLVNDQALFFEVPANVEACFKVLFAEVKRPKADTRRRIYEQAERTACKIINDWVQVQLSMILLEQAEMLQVFLPYAYDPQSDKTYYQKIKEGNFKALLP